MRDAIAEKLVPPALTEEFGEARRAVSGSVERLRDDLAAFDATLAAAAEQEPGKNRIPAFEVGAQDRARDIEAQRARRRRRQLHVRADFPRQAPAGALLLDPAISRPARRERIDGHAVRACTVGVSGSPSAVGLKAPKRRETLSIRIDVQTKKHLDALSKRSKRSKSFLAEEAIAAYVESEEWQLGEFQAGIAELDAGQNVSHEKVSKWLHSWGKTGETKSPGSRSNSYSR